MVPVNAHCTGSNVHAVGIHLRSMPLSLSLNRRLFWTNCSWWGVFYRIDSCSCFLKVNLSFVHCPWKRLSTIWYVHVYQANQKFGEGSCIVILVTSNEYSLSDTHAHKKNVACLLHGHEATFLVCYSHARLISFCKAAGTGSHRTSAIQYNLNCGYATVRCDKTEQNSCLKCV